VRGMCLEHYQEFNGKAARVSAVLSYRTLGIPQTDESLAAFTAQTANLDGASPQALYNLVSNP
jgi:hypothetical protein